MSSINLFRNIQKIRRIHSIKNKEFINQKLIKSSISDATKASISGMLISSVLFGIATIVLDKKLFIEDTK